jgi:putative DNA primase/helicase
MSAPFPIRSEPRRRDAALACARHYLAIHPCWWTKGGVCQCRKGRRCESPGKHPILERWQDVATTDPALIERWWSRWPHANIGIACGPSGILVLDIDPRHDGDETLRDLIAQYGALPETPEVLTGGGGRHIYFAAPEGITNASPFAGIDIRGEGGFVVAPGSIHASSNTYEWEVSCHPDSMPIAPAPRWLLDLLRQPLAAQGAPATHPRAAPMAERIPEGGRHRALLSIAGTLRNRGLIAEEIYGCLIVINMSRCDPPLDDSELRSLADSVEKYAVGTTPFNASPPQRPVREAEWIAL